jgi:hypothetical protein
MKTIVLSRLLREASRSGSRQLGFFAWLNLGIVELLANGALSASDAIRLFFNAENCLYVRKRMGDRIADKIMSHGVQLQDLFDLLPAKEAQQEFQRELGSIRNLSLQLLEQHELVG